MGESPLPARRSDAVVEGAVVEGEIVDGQTVEDRPAPVAATAPSAPEFDEHGVPSFEHVRDKIENRYATSLGAGELAAETPEGRTVEEQIAERDRAAAAKLEQIRRSLGR